jgi:antitoxin FitA
MHMALTFSGSWSHTGSSGAVSEPSVAVNLSVKNVPEELAELLRQRATRNRRSLQRELLSILEAAVGRAAAAPAGSTASQRALTIEELAEISRTLFPAGTESSVGFLRQLRDSR